MVQWLLTKGTLVLLGELQLMVIALIGGIVFNR
jgi:hypothetical protein